METLGAQKDFKTEATIDLQTKYRLVSESGEEGVGVAETILSNIVDFDRRTHFQHLLSMLHSVALRVTRFVYTSSVS